MRRESRVPGELVTLNEEKSRVPGKLVKVNEEGEQSPRGVGITQ